MGSLYRNGDDGGKILVNVFAFFFIILFLDFVFCSIHVSIIIMT
jgi:hypothetical protein